MGGDNLEGERLFFEEIYFVLQNGVSFRHTVRSSGFGWSLVRERKHLHDRYGRLPR